MTPFEMARTLSAMSGRKRGRKPVFSANQFYPWKVEREIERYVSEWLAENGRRLKDAALVNYTADGVDDVNSLEPFTPADVESIAASFYDKVSLFGSDALDMFGDKTIGRPIGYFFTDTTVKNDFVKNFIELCTTAAGDQKSDIANAVYQHRMFPDGKNLVKTIQDINLDYTKKKARFIARNETGNLNAVIQKTMMEGAGFTMYEWVAMPDGITRDAHRNMSGKICRCDDPTVYSDDGGKTWKKRTAGMFVGVPGQDYNCRCTAVPFEPELEDEYSIKEPELKDGNPKIETKAEKEAKRAEEAEHELLLARAEIRHLKRTPEQIADVQKRWNWHQERAFGDSYINKKIKEQKSYNFDTLDFVTDHEKDIFTTATDLKELKEMAKRMLNIEVKGKFEKLGFDRLKLELAGIHTVAKSYPQITRNFSVLKDTKRSCLGVTSIMPDKIEYVALNQDALRYSTITSSNNVNIELERGFHPPKGNLAGHTSIHESGHVLHAEALVYKDGERVKNLILMEDNCNDIVSKAITRYKLELKEPPNLSDKLLIKNEISGYAATNPCETIAESTMDIFVNKENSSRLSRLVMEELNKNLLN